MNTLYTSKLGISCVCSHFSFLVVIGSFFTNSYKFTSYKL